jgi:hypothetical protein
MKGAEIRNWFFAMSTGSDYLYNHRAFKSDSRSMTCEEFTRGWVQGAESKC